MGFLPGTPQNELMRMKMQEQHLLLQFDTVKSKTESLEQKLLKKVGQIMQAKRYNDLYENSKLLSGN